MKRFFMKLVVLASLASTVFLALAADGASPDEAIAMTKKAIAFYKSHGAEKTFAEIHKPTGRFRDRDLFVTVMDMSGKFYAQGVNPKLAGKMLIDVKDVEGKPTVKTMIDVATRKGSGWVQYKWANPVSGAIEPKSTYVEKSGDLVFLVGIYGRHS